MPLDASIEKMEAEGVHEAAIAAFTHAYEALAGGDTGILPEADIEPVNDLPRADELPEGDPEDLGKAVVIKLNGGLGTSMGMTKAKSLVEVKDGLSFLDVIARQAVTAGVPLLLMDSFRTRDDSLAVVEGYDELKGDLPLDFVQNKEPKLDAETLDPVSWEPDPDLEWCPPGHGDIYPALVASGLLDQLLEHGYETAFVSNADNLGATLDPRILSWFRGAGAAVPDGGLAPGRERPQGRPPGAPPGRRPAGARASPRRPRTRTRTPSRTSAGTSSSTPTRCGSTCVRWPPSSRPRAARCPCP